MHGVNATEMSIVKEILKTYASDSIVRAFGSRYEGKHQPWSDLDLAFEAPAGKKLSLIDRGKISEAFSCSDLPYKVDVIDYNGARSAFRQLIDASHKIIYNGC